MQADIRGSVVDVTRAELWKIVEKLEAAGLAHTTYDATSDTTCILLHPGVKLDLDDMDQGLVIEDVDIPFGGTTTDGMMCTCGGYEPTEWLNLVIAAHDGFGAPWHYILIDEGRCDWMEPDEDDA